MIILLPKQVQECQCALCNARRLDEQETIDAMEDRLRSLREPA